MPVHRKIGPQKSSENAFKPNIEILNKNKRDWENLTIEEYKKVFKKSPVKRAKYSGLKRNILNNV